MKDGVQDEAKAGLQLWVRATDFILVLLINDCIIFHMNNYRTTFTWPNQEFQPMIGLFPPLALFWITSA